MNSSISSILSRIANSKSIIAFAVASILLQIFGMIGLLNTTHFPEPPIETLLASPTFYNTISSVRYLVDLNGFGLFALFLCLISSIRQDGKRCTVLLVFSIVVIATTTFLAFYPLPDYEIASDTEVFQNNFTNNNNDSIQISTENNQDTPEHFSTKSLNSTILLIGGIISFCSLLDYFIGKEGIQRGKVSLIKWWVYLDDYSYSDATLKANRVFNEVFSVIFGRKMLSWQCLFVSTISSMLSVVIISLLFVVFYSVKPSQLLGLPSQVGPYWGTLLSYTIMINIWVDYISLNETRLILRISAKHKVVRLPFLLAIDFVASAFLYISFWCLVTFVLPNDFGFQKAMKLFVVILLNPITLFQESEPSIKVAFLSTFLTSFFFYLFCLVTFLFKLLSLSKTRIMVLIENLESSGHLFKAIGGLLAAFVGLLKFIQGT